jgi:hypothetical protein
MGSQNGGAANNGTNYNGNKPEPGNQLSELDKPVFVMNYSGISREVIPEAVSRMNRAVKTLL